jgi:hypothetical protein
MTFLEAQQALSRKLNIDFTDIANNDLFSLADLKEWIQFATHRVWDYKPWDFTEGAKKVTTANPSYTNGYYDYPQDFASGSTYLLKVADKEYKKLLFQDYLKYKEDYPDEDKKYWAEHKRFVFVNSKAYAVGDELCLFGKLKAPTLSADADLLPFSPDTDNQEYSGNQAIITLAYSEALDSEKLKNPAKAAAEEAKALRILDALWKPFAESRSLQQSKNRPFFDVPDYFAGSNRTSPIGNFNL